MKRAIDDYYCRGKIDDKRMQEKLSGLVCGENVLLMKHPYVTAGLQFNNCHRREQSNVGCCPTKPEHRKQDLLMRQALSTVYGGPLHRVWDIPGVFYRCVEEQMVQWDTTEAPGMPAKNNW